MCQYIQITQGAVLVQVSIIAVLSQGCPCSYCQDHYYQKEWTKMKNYTSKRRKRRRNGKLAFPARSFQQNCVISMTILTFVNKCDKVTQNQYKSQLAFSKPTTNMYSQARCAGGRALGIETLWRTPQWKCGAYKTWKYPLIHVTYYLMTLSLLGTVSHSTVCETHSKGFGLFPFKLIHWMEKTLFVVISCISGYI